jgi:hypothetical protein
MKPGVLPPPTPFWNCEIVTLKGGKRNAAGWRQKCHAIDAAGLLRGCRGRGWRFSLELPKIFSAAIFGA